MQLTFRLTFTVAFSSILTMISAQRIIRQRIRWIGPYIACTKHTIWFKAAPGQVKVAWKFRALHFLRTAMRRLDVGSKFVC